VLVIFPLTLCDEIPAVALDAFGVFDNLFEALFFLARCGHPVRGDFEHAAPGGLLGAFVRVRFVAVGLRFPQQGEEQRVLRNGLQSRRDPVFSGRRGIVVQAAAQHIGHVGLRRQQRRGEKARRQALAGSRAGLGDSPAEDFAEPGIDAPRALDVVEILTVPGLLEQRGAALAELFHDAPDALRLGLEGEVDQGIGGAGPGDVGLAMLRGVRQQERQADRIREGRFSEVVRTVQNVQARSEGDVQRRQRGEALNAQAMEPQRAHRAPPINSSWRCNSL
jgi:hypothetical protein